VLRGTFSVAPVARSRYRDCVESDPEERQALLAGVKIPLRMQALGGAWGLWGTHPQGAWNRIC